MFNTAIIMAGGKGTRMFPVSDYVPKPLVRIHDKCLIDHCIDELKNNNVKNIYVTYGYKSELLVSHVEKKVSGLINTINQDNSFFLYNTIIKYLDEPTIIIPCDIIMSVDFSKLFDEYNPEHVSYILPTKFKAGMNPDFIKHNVETMQIEDIGRHFKTDICASGIQITNPKKIVELTNDISKNNWHDVWNSLMKLKKLHIFKNYVEKWETYDTLEQLLITEDV